MEGSGMFMLDGINLAVPSAEQAEHCLGADSTTVNFKVKGNLKGV
jgi:hypothetical protein